MRMRSASTASASGAATTSGALVQPLLERARTSSPRIRAPMADRQKASLESTRRTPSGGSYSRVRTWYSLMPRGSYGAQA